MTNNTLKCKQQAFTLLEMLLALSLATMVLTLLSGGMFVVVKDWERSSQRLDNQLDLTLGLLQIDRSLQAAFPHYYKDGKKNTPHIYFEGDSDTLSWVSTSSPARKAGLTAWHLQRGDNNTVELRVAPTFTDNPEKRLKKQEPVVLFEDYKIHFEYLFYDKNKRGEEKGKTKWLDKWEGHKRLSLPNAVRVRLEHNELPSIEIISLIQAHEHARLAPKKIK